jgi:nucleotide-binding universal stress UspA family protein
MRLLVPLDGTDHAEAALPAARVLARAMAGSIVLARVIHPSASAEVSRHHHAEAEQGLAAVRDELLREDLDVKLVIQASAPAEQIVDAVRATGADVIVMATHGRSGLERAFAGSVAEQVIGESPYRCCCSSRAASASRR